MLPYILLIARIEAAYQAQYARETLSYEHDMIYRTERVIAREQSEQAQEGYAMRHAKRSLLNHMITRDEALIELDHYAPLVLALQAQLDLSVTLHAIYS